MTANLPAGLWEAGIVDQRYTLHLFRVGGAASHNTDGTAAMDVLIEYVGWKSKPAARRYVGQTGLAVGQGASKRSRDVAFIAVDATPLSKEVMSSHPVFRKRSQYGTLSDLTHESGYGSATET